MSTTMFEKVILCVASSMRQECHFRISLYINIILRWKLYSVHLPIINYFPSNQLICSTIFFFLIELESAWIINDELTVC